MSTWLNCARASVSVRPTVPTSGCENTAVGMVDVIDLHRTLAEHGVGEGMALADRDRRQIDAMGDVADRIDVRHRASCEKSSTAMPPFFGLMATPAFSRPRLATLGCRPDREHHLVGGDARSVRQMRGEFLAVLVDLGRPCSR